MLAQIPLLAISDDVITLASEIIIEIQLLPNAHADGYYMAASVLHGMDYLLTWNFKHIANIHFQRRLQRFIEGLGYAAPVMCSPQDFVFIEDPFDLE